MTALLIEFALFFLLLLFVMPSLMIFLMILREVIHQHRKHLGSQPKWHRRDMGELTGWQESPPA